MTTYIPQAVNNIRYFLHYFTSERLRIFLSPQFEKKKVTKTPERSRLEPKTIRSRIFGLSTWAKVGVKQTGEGGKRRKKKEGGKRGRRKGGRGERKEGKRKEKEKKCTKPMQPEKSEENTPQNLRGRSQFSIKQIFHFQKSEKVLNIDDLVNGG